MLDGGNAPALKGTKDLSSGEVTRCVSNNQNEDMPSLKRTISNLKIASWETILSFRETIFSCAMLVSGIVLSYIIFIDPLIFYSTLPFFKVIWKCFRDVHVKPSDVKCESQIPDLLLFLTHR